MMSQDKARQDVRQEMYKNYSKSPSWKEKFRKRCLERLKDSRGKLMSSRRPLDCLCEMDVKDYDWNDNRNFNMAEMGDKTGQTRNEPRIPEIDIIMREEIDRLRREISSSDTMKLEYCSQEKVDSCDEKTYPTEPRSSSSRITNDSFTFADNDIGWYEEIYDILKAELDEERQRKESQQNIGDELLRHEEESLCSAIQSLSTEDVICPLCKKFNLMEQKNVILCQCGMKIHIEQDIITLKYVKKILTAGAEEHSQKCESEPSFSLNQKFGISNLLMSCQDCDFLFVVI